MQQKIYDFLMNNGAGQVGFAKLSGNNFSMPYAISYTIPLSNAIVNQIDKAPTHTYFHHYRSVNAYIDRLSLEVGLMLQDAGFNYVPIPASQSVNGLQGIFSHKEAAVKAGLGTIGKSSLFISKKHGPRIRLGTILTDCEFKVPKKPLDSICKDCNICKLSCPAMAITGQEWSKDRPLSDILDAKACSDYMKTEFQHIGRGVVCGICMKVCPKYKNKGLV